MKTRTKTLAVVEIAIVLCSVFLVTMPAQAAEQTTQKMITTASEDEFTLGIYGNANEDDTIDMRDTTYIKLVIFGKKPKTDLADANYDGKVSMLDVGQTKLIILGKEKGLTLIDLADRAVTIDKPVERVVMIYNAEPDYLAVEGDFKKMVGWSGHLKQYRAWMCQKYTEKFPEIEDIPVVGSMWDLTLNVEKVITLKPDIVIFGKGNFENAKTAVEQLEQAGIPSIFIDYHAQTTETHTKSTLLLGYVLDKKERAQDLVDLYKEQINEVYSRIEKIDKTKPKVYVECGWKGPSEYGGTYGDYMAGALIEKCGGINIAKGIVEKFGPINPEYLLDTNPDIIFISGSYWPATPDSMRLGYYADPEESREFLKAFTERPGWDTLNAVKNHRVYSFHEGLSGRHTYDFVTVLYLAKCFYPDEFADLDPEESFKEFHERFMPVDYSGVWMLSLEE